MIEDEFDAAASHLQHLISEKLAKEPQDLLYLYARYKQATCGRCESSKPSFTNISGRRKWQAWNNLEDMSQIVAMKEYIDKIKQIDPRWRYDGKDWKEGVKLGMTVSTLQKDFEEFELGEEEKTVFDWCKEGNLKEVAGCYDNQTTTLLTDEQGRSLLHWACDREHLDIVEFLLEKKHPVNCQDGDGLSPLHYAASCDSLHIASLLIRHGGDVDVKDCDDETPMDCATSKQMKQLLMSCGK